MSAAATPPPSSSHDGRMRTVWSIVGALAALVVVSGLIVLFRQPRRETLADNYGQRRGTGSEASVNGTSVLAEMFKSAGHRVTTVDELSPKLKKYDIILWTPDDFEPPTAEQREFLEEWLAGGEGRTLIYVGRDYDAAPAYWKKVQPLVPPNAADDVQRELAQAQAKYDTERVKMPKQQYARWFTTHREGKRHVVQKLQGPWAKGIDAKQTDIEVEGGLQIPRAKDLAGTSELPLPDDFETLLKSSADDLAWRVTDSAYGDGQVIVVSNGSFLLNYPLVNHENRKLAARMIDECGAAGQVAFVESGPGGPDVSDKEAGAEAGGLELLKVWPLNAILLHLTILGIVLCIARSVIFGRPRELPGETRSDFGKHVSALGQLLARTKDRGYALARVKHYREQAQRGSGKSHRLKK
jgi:hypothetical protein